jgi:hypothetical protein
MSRFVPMSTSETGAYLESVWSYPKVNEPSRQYLTRKEAAAYLTQTWFKVSAATLARYSSDGIGPPFRQVPGTDGHALYDRADLTTWAASFPTVRREDENGRRKRPELAPSKARSRRLLTAGAR